MKHTLRIVIVTLLLCGVFGATQSKPAQAVTGSEFRPGRIIDDSVFINKNSMSPSQIQLFLESKVAGGSCDTDGSRPSTRWYTAANRYYTHAEWGALNGNPAPFVCLTTYRENPTTKQTNLGNPTLNIPGSQSAAEIIYNAGQQYNINPQVLIVLLQKEQSLITDDWPWLTQYSSATGAYCPDTAPCDASQAGFGTQVREAARLFRYYMDTPFLYFIGNNYVRYNPNAACGGTTVYIENLATEALYHYTPYQPNAAALNNLYGTGDSCSAYGNRNFWRMFNDWFGSTIGPDYAWSIDGYTYSGGDSYIAQGQTETITLRARNVGRLPWYNHGDHPVRLGTWEPAGRTSSLFQTNRLANMQENVVLPNEVGTFIFTVTPSTVGTYVEGLNLVAENYQWLQWAGLRPTIQVTPAYAWELQNIIYESGTGYMEPGTRQLVTVIVKNIGGATWNKLGPTPVRLGTWQPGRQSAVSQTWPSPIRAADSNDITVAPGATTGFQFYITMPRSGIFYEKFNLVAEGLTWLNNQDMTLYLEGKSYAWQPLWYSPTTSNINIPRNTEFGITVKVKNTGTMTWKKAGPFPVKLGTTFPHNRDSAFYTPLWPERNRAAILVEDTVPPNGEGTFLITAKTPNTPGPWHENFNLVAEGVLWFDDPKFVIHINVL
jgi:hypothetical protein